VIYFFQFPAPHAPPNLYKFLFSPILSTCPSHFIVPDLVTRIIFHEQYRSRRSRLCSFLQCPVTSSLLGPNNLLTAQSVKGGSNVSCRTGHYSIYKTDGDKIQSAYGTTELSVANWTSHTEDNAITICL